LIKQIFLDLDDVCNTLTPYALNCVGCPIDETDFGAYKPEWGFDIVKAANALHPYSEFTLETFWGSITRGTWASIPESPEFRSLLALCERLVGRENICILTTSIDDPDCLAGKLDWIHKHFPEWMHRQYLMGGPKHLCAGPNALLLDDNDENVRAFRENGGCTIVVPRPWNCLSYLLPPDGNALPYITNALTVYPFWKSEKQAA
jgi:hypothetical protein